jgi:hypothetical protein
MINKGTGLKIFFKKRLQQQVQGFIKQIVQLALLLKKDQWHFLKRDPCLL